MIECIDSGTYESLGFEYTKPETETAITALFVYGSVLMHDVIPANARVNREQLRRVAQLYGTVRKSGVIPLDVHADMVGTCLPFLVALGEGLDSVLAKRNITLERACGRLGVTTQVFSDGVLIARAMLEPDGHALRYISPK